jgi:hypothetical protein
MPENKKLTKNDLCKLSCEELDAIEGSLVDGSNQSLLNLVYQEQFKRILFNITSSFPEHYEQMSDEEGWAFAIEHLSKLLANRKAEASQFESGMSPERRQKTVEFVENRIRNWPGFQQVLADVKQRRTCNNSLPSTLTDEEEAMVMAMANPDPVLDFLLELRLALKNGLSAESIDDMTYRWAKYNDVYEHAVVSDYVGYKQLEHIYNHLRNLPAESAEKATFSSRIPIVNRCEEQQKEGRFTEEWYAEQHRLWYEDRWNRRWRLFKGHAKNWLLGISAFVALVAIWGILRLCVIDPLDAWVAKTSYWISIPTFLGVGFVVLVCITICARLKKYNCKITLFCTCQGICRIVMDKECIWKSDIPHTFIERFRTEKPDGSILVANMKIALDDGIGLRPLFAERNLRTRKVYFTAIGTHIIDISMNDENFYRENDDDSRYSYQGGYTFGHVELPHDIAQYAVECMFYAATKEKKEKDSLKHKIKGNEK